MRRDDERERHRDWRAPFADELRGVRGITRILHRGEDCQKASGDSQLTMIPQVSVPIVHSGTSRKHTENS